MKEQTMKLIDKLGMCWRILNAEPSNLMTHAEKELPFIGSDDMAELMSSQLKEMVLLFTTHGHSGFSAKYAISILTKLLEYRPITPLTGNDDEWNEVSDGVFQNKRCSRIFKQANHFDGQAYDIGGRVFREPNGVCYTSQDSRVVITFPYIPTTEYIDVPASH